MSVALPGCVCSGSGAKPGPAWPAKSFPRLASRNSQSVPRNQAPEPSVGFVTE